jgi:hypothetical protein
MNTIYFYIYLLSVFVFFLIYSTIKCVYKIDIFDTFLYKDKLNSSTLSYIIYYITHFILYFIFGLLFSFDILVSMTLKTIIVEYILIIIKDCTLNNTNNDNIENALESIIVGMLSYIIGCIVITIYNNMKK